MDKDTTLRFQKNVDKARNRMVIPKFFIDKWGKSFYMEVDSVNGKITLTAIKKGE